MGAARGGGADSCILGEDANPHLLVGNAIQWPTVPLAVHSVGVWVGWAARLIVRSAAARLR